MADQRPITGDQIRAAFLRFFEERGHLVVPSASLIPAGDPTLLLTSAGMVPFKPYYAGDEQPPNRRLASAQKSFRTTDIDEVGDLTHLTFFEMLGNFSIGDYFKRETIEWAWEFVTDVLGLDPERLFVTVHEGDDEAEAIWRDEVGVAPERISRCGDADNFWGPAGAEGACGPSSELHYDLHPDREGHPDRAGTPCDDPEGRFVEIWNLVFPQFHQAPDGTRTDLPAPGIDTGLGLERVAAIMQGVASLYETDLFVPILQRVEETCKVPYGASEETDRAIRVVAEHARAAVFLIADGVVPANEGRGYVLRRVIRRGIRFARKLGVEGAFLARVAEAVEERMGAAYPELIENRRFVHRTLEAEEERFAEAFEIGSGMLKGMVDFRNLWRPKIDQVSATLRDSKGNVREALQQFYIFGEVAEDPDEDAGRNLAFEALVSAVEKRRPQSRAQAVNVWLESLTGHEGFFIYDTHGFPLELTQEVAREHGLDVDVEGFEREMEAQRERGRAAARFGGPSSEEGRAYEALGVDPSTFTGYEALAGDSVIVGILRGGEPVERVDAGDEVEIVLRETPFYPEGGGQVGDTGVIGSTSGSARVWDTRKPTGEIIAHFATVSDGRLSVGDAVGASVDADRRLDVARNHTATHLLHAVLRDVLGTHVRQAGSLVASDRLRFDFTHVAAVTPAELATIERTVNEAIRDDLALLKREQTYRDATASGALAFFGERYPDSVRTVQIGGEGQIGEDAPVSYEVCGGTHLAHTGQIGFFHIVSESSIGTGVRRIEAVTGRGSEAWIGERLGLLDVVAAKLRTTPADASFLGRIDALLEQAEAARKSSAAGGREASRREAEELLGRAQDVDGVTVLAAQASAADADAMREMGDWLRDKLGSAVVVLGGVFGDRPSLLAMVTSDLVDRGYDAGDIVRAAARPIGGGGGGRPQLAQAGGKDASKLADALEAAVAAVRAHKS